MVKGVNRHIIEINDTGSKYFERVLLFITPGREDMSEERLRQEAQNYVLRLSDHRASEQSLRSRVSGKSRKRRFFIATGLAVCIAAVTFIILNIL